MTPPSGSPAPVTERRLAVLLSHFHPPAACRLACAERSGTAAAAAGAGAGLYVYPCAGGKGEEDPSGFGRCVFCNIVAGTLQAFKAFSDHSKKPLSITADNTPNCTGSYLLKTAALEYCNHESYSM